MKDKINWIAEKCRWDDLKKFRYTNFTDMRPYTIKRCVMNELRAENRKRFFRRLKENIVFAIKGVGILAGMWLLLVLILLL
jgi:hypothetical protein